MSTIWDWPNQQAVRPDHSGPGMNTPPGIPSDVQITYGHAGLSYEFLLLTTAGEPVTGQVNWDFGDGANAIRVDAAVPVAHTYATPGMVNVKAFANDRVRNLQIEVTE